MNPELDNIKLTRDPLSVGLAADWVTTPDSGGICVFAGTTRMESRGEGRLVIGLEYEAHEEMAVRVMGELADEVRAVLLIRKIVMWHRLGRVNPGEPSVVIAVSAAHRQEAFDACRRLIDRLKQAVPIWKKEIFEDGGGAWTAGTPLLQVDGF